jgi:hypothetical protein
MTDTPSDPPSADAPMSSGRLAAFQQEVGQLKVSGGGANPERLGSLAGLAVIVVGLAGAVICFFGAYNATRFEVIQRLIVLGAAFGALAVVGAVVWVRNSLTRYLRYWLIRLIYEQREQTGTLVAEQRQQMERLIASIRENDKT